MNTHPELSRTFAPTGTLRASINLGNPILANKNPRSGAPEGVSVDLARGLAERLHVPLELLVFDTALKSVDAVANGAADFGFFAIDPKRGESIAFTAAYVLIEGAYMVRQDSPLQGNDEVDRAEHRLVVGLGSAYDLYLSREIKAANIVRADTSAAVVNYFLQNNCEVAAGVKQQLEMDIARIPGLRLLPGRFMVIQQAMAVPKTKGESAAQYLRAYVEEMKASGFVAQALERHRIQGASVAPAV